MRKARIRTSEGGDPVDVVIDRADELQHESYLATIGDRHVPVEIETADDRSGWLRVHGRIVPFRALRRDDTIQVWLDGRMHTLHLAERTARRASDAAAAGASSDLTAPMPGTILKVNIEVGATFEAHEPLIVMESMKMEMTLSAPTSGRVTELLCAVGELVEMGELLARLEPDS
jgi:biotin carboxyl carrier protein